MHHFFIVFALLFTICKELEAQSSILDNFQANALNQEVVLNWTITAGYTCNGIGIFKSEDSLNFAEIGEIEGICGSVDKAENYTFSDKDPLVNKKNYYRLELGGVGSSEIVTAIYYETGQQGHLVLPNPGRNNMSVIFRNSRGEEVKFVLFDQKGAELFSREGRGERFDLNMEAYSGGLYLFRISYNNGEEITRGKMVLQ